PAPGGRSREVEGPRARGARAPARRGDRLMSLETRIAALEAAELADVHGFSEDDRDTLEALRALRMARLVERARGHAPTPYASGKNWRIWHGDSLAWLDGLADDYADA